MPSIRDFLAGQSTESLTWCRPIHRTQNRVVTASCFCCCLCIAPNCCWILEMWGQGGGGAGSCCCMWGIYGGRGGDYGWRSFPCGCGTAPCLCMCSCFCGCRTPGSTGHQGQFGRVTNTANSTCYCVFGGQGGCNCCWQQGADGGFCGCNMEFDIDSVGLAVNAAGATRDHRQRQYVFSNVNCISTEWQCTSGNCLSTDWFSQKGNTSSNSIDNIFHQVCCACFCHYRRGACGWSCYRYGECRWFNTEGLGVGGAAYAGGHQQRRTGQSCGSGPCWAFCGADGYVPGGGGHAAGSCGGGCCCGSSGGGGLILISWGT